MFDLDRQARNITPDRYRYVALSSGLERLDAEFLEAHFSGREVYMRTRFVVARDRAGATALVEVDKPEGDALFVTSTAARLLAGPAECVYVQAPEVDVGIPAHLASVAVAHPEARCVVVEGRYAHVSFLLNPAPLRVEVLDIVPPTPSKLFDQVTRVLDTAEDLPPIHVTLRSVDSRLVLADDRHPVPDEVLVPCRGGGVDVGGVHIDYLDERPDRAGWTLLGCKRSLNIHRWFYGDEPPMVDICPQRFSGGCTGTALLTRCCELQVGIEGRDDGVYVPWGCSLAEIRQALELVIEREGFVWTPT